MCRRVETDYREAAEEAERVKRVAQILSEGVYACLKKRGLLAANGAQGAQNDRPKGDRPGGEESP